MIDSSLVMMIFVHCHLHYLVYCLHVVILCFAHGDGLEHPLEEISWRLVSAFFFVRTSIQLNVFYEGMLLGISDVIDFRNRPSHCVFGLRV